MAQANPHHRETLRFAGEKVVALLRNADLVGGPGLRWWRASSLLGPQAVR